MIAQYVTKSSCRLINLSKQSGFGNFYPLNCVASNLPYFDARSIRYNKRRNFTTVCDLRTLNYDENMRNMWSRTTAVCRNSSLRDAPVREYSNDQAKVSHSNDQVKMSQSGTPKEVKATVLGDGKSSDKAEPLTKVQMLKKAVAEYGSTVIVFHVTISLVSLGVCYLLISSGFDVGQAFNFLGFQGSKVAQNAGTFVAAYAIHKVMAPLRISITLGATPLIVRYLRNRGILKK